MVLFDAVSVEKKHLDRGGHEERGSEYSRHPDQRVYESQSHVVVMSLVWEKTSYAFAYT